MKTNLQKKKMIFGVIVVVLITILCWWKEQKESVLSEDGKLWRQEKGQGEYEVELVLQIAETEETEIAIIVPEQRLGTKEEAERLSFAIEELEAEFLGKNKSLEEVRNAVVIRESYQEGMVSAEWEFSNDKLISSDGVVEESAMAGDSEAVEARVNLTCEDSSLTYEFGFVVYRQEKSKEEVFYEKLKQLILESGKKEGTEFLCLPTDVEGYALEWKNKKPKLPLQVFLLGMLVVALLPIIEKERKKEAEERRRAELLRCYPDMVNKLSLLIGAGMTLQGAWRKVTEKYVEERKRGQRERSVLYEEMLITRREIESGKSEGKAYEAFGERCAIQKYRKFSSYLISTMKKGNQKLCEWLERESEEAFLERRHLIQQYGEELSTKLLFPMLLMLGIVILIIMVPAVISFQAGIN